MGRARVWLIGAGSYLWRACFSLADRRHPDEHSYRSFGQALAAA